MSGAFTFSIQVNACILTFFYDFRQKLIWKPYFYVVLQSENFKLECDRDHWCQFNVKPSWRQRFALTPSPFSQPGRGEVKD